MAFPWAQTCGYENHNNAALAYLFCADDDASTTDLKWSIAELKRFMATKHGADPVDECFAGIQAIILNSLRAVANVIINFHAAGRPSTTRAGRGTSPSSSTTRAGSRRQRRSATRRFSTRGWPPRGRGRSA